MLLLSWPRSVLHFKGWAEWIESVHGIRWAQDSSQPQVWDQ